MRTSENGLRLIEGFEGFSAVQYRDSVGVPTIGFGTTSADISPLPSHCTRAQAEQWLAGHLRSKYEPAVNALGAPLNQNQFDALVSFAYNLGPGSMQWDVGRFVRARNYKAAANAMLQYDHAGGQRLAGLTRRRQAERALFLKPVAPAKPIKPGSRSLHLVSPLMRGQDVVALQRALHVHVDGVYGPGTAHAVTVRAWRLGLGHTDAVPAVQRIILGKRRRSPLDLRRAKQRAKEAAKTKAQGTGLTGILKHAQSHIGVAEHPAGSNWGEHFPAQWLRNFHFGPASWCGAFAGSMILATGGHVGSRVAYCPFIESDAKTGTGGFDRWTTNPHDGVQPGWLVLYDWTGRKSFPEHVGVVESIEADHLVAVEGNTGGSNPSDGGMVARAVRPYGFVVGFARPRL